MDLASFRPQDILAVYGGRPTCLVTNRNYPLELHHVLKRGYDHGARPNDEKRKMFSSVFNCAPLSIEVHNGPRIHRPSFQAFLLDVVREIVMNAVQAGEYILRQEDKDFLEFVDATKSRF